MSSNTKPNKRDMKTSTTSPREQVRKSSLTDLPIADVFEEIKNQVWHQRYGSPDNDKHLLHLPKGFKASHDFGLGASEPVVVFEVVFVIRGHITKMTEIVATRQQLCGGRFSIYREAGTPALYRDTNKAPSWINL